MVTRLVEHWQHAPDWHFIVLSQHRDEMGNDIDWGNVEFIQLDGGLPPLHPHLFTWLQAQQGVFYAHWQRIAEQRAIDLTYLPMPWWTVRLPEFTPPTPIVPTLHDFAWHQLKMPLHEFQGEAQLFAKHAALTVFPSVFQREWGETYFGFRSTRTIYHGHFIPPGFLPTPLEAQRVRDIYGLPEQYVLAFHCASSKKDPLTILQAQIKARRESADVPALVIAGLDTEWFVPNSIKYGHPAWAFAKQVWNVMAEFTLNRDLFVLGNVPVKDMGGLYAGAKMAVTATHNEGGISGTMFEAFAAHVPCVYTELPVFSERLSPEEYGFTFAPGHVRGCAEAIVRACTDTEQAYERAERALAFANSRTWGDAAQEYLEAFEGVLR